MPTLTDNTPELINSSTGTEILVKLSQVSVQRDHRLILENIDLEVAGEEIVSLIGPNGAGKSTLIKVLLGLTQPLCGSVWKRPGLRIGYMPQRLELAKTIPLTVRRFLCSSQKNNHIAVDSALERVGALHTASQPMQEVSGGELQRILLARTLLRRPHLLVLDEPVQGVDVNGQAALYQLITEIRDELHCGVLLVSHDLHLVMSTTDRVICLNHHVCCSGHPDRVSNDPVYHKLFGMNVQGGVAMYAHHHDHAHDDSGQIIATEPTDD